VHKIQADPRVIFKICGRIALNRAAHDLFGRRSRCSGPSFSNFAAERTGSDRRIIHFTQFTMILALFFKF